MYVWSGGGEGDGGGGRRCHKPEISFSEISIQMKNTTCLKSLVLDDECLGSIVNDIYNELNLLSFKTAA